MGHYRGRVDAWDVVNEPLAADGSLRRNFWLRELGPGYVADALRWAHEANPGARLYVNDFNIEGRSRKTHGMLALLKRLRDERVPVDGIGLQSHLTSSFHPGRAELRSTMRRYASLGLTVDVSEMDVATPAGPAGRAPAGADLPPRGGGVSRPAGLQPLHHLGLHRRVDLARHREAPAPVQRRGRAEARLARHPGRSAAVAA